MLQLRAAQVYTFPGAFKAGVDAASLSKKEMGLTLLGAGGAAIGAVLFGWPTLAIVLSILGVATVCYLGLYAITAHLGVITSHLMNLDALSRNTFSLALDAACIAAGLDKEPQSEDPDDLEENP